MDKLHSEYEALQQKLALLRRTDSASGTSSSAATPAGGDQRLRPLQQAQAVLAGTPSRSALQTKHAALPSELRSIHQRLAAENRAPSLNGPPLPPAHATGGAAGDAPACSSGADGGTQLAGDAAALLQSICFSGRHTGSALCAAAAAAFEDAEFVRLCEQSMSVQLQRTKEGATAQSRILELAGMVKVLRRCLKEALTRTSSLVDQGARMERQMTSNAESAHLDTGSFQRRLEADAALARKEAAQVEAMYKSERAQWVAEVDMQKFEVARLARELEALEDQRARAREDAQRSERSRIQLEAEVKELRKSADQRVREVTVTQGEAERALRDERAAAERREAQLQEEVQELRQGMQAAQQRASGLQSHLSALQAAQQSLQASLEGKQSAEAALAAQLAQAHSQIGDLRSQLAAAQADRSALQQDLRSAQNQVTLLENEARLKGTRLEAAERALEAEQARHAQEAGCLEDQLRQAQSAQRQAQSEALSASGEAEEARRQASDGAAARARAEVALQHLQQQHEALQAEHAALRQRAQAAADAEADARSSTSALQARAAEAEAALSAAKSDAAAQAGRLALLEGEFTALQEMMGEGEQRDVVSRLLARIGALQRASAEAEATRRQLHNQMVELRGNIRVFCRVRPHPTSAVRCLPGAAALALSVDGREHPFSFDRVFGPQAGQAQVFSEVSELVQSALDGYHVCLFSYGQTGAGKTYTMQGTPEPEGAGIIPRSVDLILSRVAALSAQEWEYSLEASFIEVYNNTLRDLLADGAARSPDAGRISDANAIKHDAFGGHTTVVGASRVPVSGAGHAAELVRRAAEARACAETAMNSSSSRSHCVFMLYIEGAHPASGTRLAGCLCLVDLAGSERLDRSLAEGQAKKEACSINQSLSALGDVFASLAAKSSHVPYRNSKLTYLLQPCLGGNGKTLMFVNINPEPASAGESLCSLKFAAKVNACETAAKGGARRNIGAAGGGGGGMAQERFGSSFAPMDSSFDSGRPSLIGKRGALGSGGSMGLLGSTDKGPKRSRLA